MIPSKLLNGMLITHSEISHTLTLTNTNSEKMKQKNNHIEFVLITHKADP